MNRAGTKLDARWGRRSLSSRLRTLFWRWRWILLLAGLLVIGPLTTTLLQRYLTRFGIAWITLPVEYILLIALLVIGVQRENRRPRPIPPPPRPPGHESDESIQAAAPAPLNLHSRQAA